MAKPQKQSNSDFEKGRQYIRILLCVAMVIVGTSYFVAAPGTPQQTGSLIAGFACVLATVFVNFKYCRCPYCGKVLFTGFNYHDTCPRCKRTVNTSGN